MEAHYNFANYDLLIGTIMNYQDWGLLDIASIFGPDYDRINIFYSTPVRVADEEDNCCTLYYYCSCT